MLWLLTQMELEWPGAHSRVTARYLPLPSQLKGLCCRTHLLLPPEIIPFLVAFTFIPPPIRKINGRANLLSLRSRNWRSFPGGHRVVKQLPSTRSLTHTRSNFPALVSLTPGNCFLYVSKSASRAAASPPDVHQEKTSNFGSANSTNLRVHLFCGSEGV